MKNILILGFKGKNNYSKILLDSIEDKSYIDKLYLKNNFKLSKEQSIKINFIRCFHIIC